MDGTYSFIESNLAASLVDKTFTFTANVKVKANENKISSYLYTILKEVEVMNAFELGFDKDVLDCTYSSNGYQ